MAAPNPGEFRHASRATLPVELVDSLNQAYFLHRLATEPEKVIPPGKTLLSMMIQSQMHSYEATQNQKKNILERVTEVAHQAFWNEAVESLSSPQPSVQLPRLKRLYGDLADALAPLYPPDHKILQSLRAHLPPTTSPLHYALEFLKELLRSLRERCAPVRDQALNQLYAKLDDWRDPIPEVTSNQSEGAPSRLADLIVDTVRSIVSLSEHMKSDLNAVILGSMSEQEVKAFVLQQAKIRERELVLELWDTKHQSPSGHLLRERWRSWVALVSHSMETSFPRVPSEHKWILRLMEQLATNAAISCNSPTTAHEGPQMTESQIEMPPNELPPHFLFFTPKLLYIQNYLQAITIAASLRVLAQIPPSTGHEFLNRVWPLLKTEIDENDHGPPDELGSTKIINLADEVVRTRMPIDANQEKQVREAVERTLRPQDPVFMLLHRRLTESLTRQVLEYMAGTGETSHPGREIPENLKTGRTIGTRPVKVDFTDHSNPSPRASMGGATAAVVIRGFEDPTLLNEIRSILGELIVCVSWTEMVWGDLVW